MRTLGYLRISRNSFGSLQALPFSVSRNFRGNLLGLGCPVGGVEKFVTSTDILRLPKCQICGRTDVY